jgi:hypothetical protein
MHPDFANRPSDVSPENCDVLASRLTMPKLGKHINKSIVYEICCLLEHHLPSIIGRPSLPLTT